MSGMYKPSVPRSSKSGGSNDEKRRLYGTVGNESIGEQKPNASAMLGPSGKSNKGPLSEKERSFGTIDKISALSGGSFPNGSPAKRTMPSLSGMAKRVVSN